MKKRIVMPVLVLSLFLSLFTSCGIPTIFTFSDANDKLTLRNNSLTFTKDDGVFTGNLMFLYFVTDLTGDELVSAQTSLISEFKSEYVVSSYNSTNIPNKGEQPVVTKKIDDASFSLYQLVVNGQADNQNCNMQNWANSYMFTLDEGEYSIQYNLEDRNLVIQVYNEESMFKGVTLRCDGSIFDFNDTDSYFDYTLTSGNVSNLGLYVLPVIVISAPGYNNKLMYVSSDFAAIDL